MRRLGRWLPLAAVVAGAAALRLWGLTQGLPNVNTRPDERELLEHTARFAAGDLNPRWFVYPNFYFYLVWAWEQALLAARRLWLPTPAWPEMLTQAMPTAILYGRLLSALAGTATVALVYAAGRRLGGRALGLLAALLLAANFLHVRDSHVLKDEILLPVGVLASLWTLARWVERPGPGRAVLAGLAIGLATALMYSGILLVAPAYLAAVLASPRRGLARLLPHTQLALVGLAAALAFLATCPFLLLDFENTRSTAAFATAVIYGTPPEARPGPTAGWVDGARLYLASRAYGYHLAVSLRHGCGLLVALAAPSAVVFAWRPPRRPFLVLSAAFLVFYYLAIGSSRVHFARFVTPVTPLLALLVARLVLAVAERATRQWALVAAGFAVALAGEPLAKSIAYDRIASRTDTRVLATRWMAEHLPAGAVVAQLGSGVFGIADPDLPPAVRKAPLRLGETDLAQHGVTHVVTHSHQLPYSQPNAALLQRLGPQLRLLAEFTPYRDGPAGRFEAEDAYYVPIAGFCGVERPGPLVRVYAYSGGPHDDDPRLPEGSGQLRERRSR